MNHTDSFRILKLYRRIGLLTCSSVFLLFLLGALVRATGSGMGCPDWPKCFGLLAPPTCECQLPPNYIKIFKEKREKKVHRFATTLRKFGFQERANAIEADSRIFVQEKFDPVKAWIEYINRLFGVLSGLFGLVFFILTIRYEVLRKSLYWMFLGFVFLLLNAWLGSLVVATNLLPGIVSLHFLLSYISLFGFIKAVEVHGTILKTHSIGKSFQWSVLWKLVLFIVILGTWGREQVELLKIDSKLIEEGMLNFRAMGKLFAIHRYLPAFVLLFSGYQWFKNKYVNSVNHWLVIAIISFIQIALGAIHIVYVVPVWTQVLHVVIGSSLVTYLFLVHTSFREKK